MTLLNLHSGPGPETAGGLEIGTVLVLGVFADGVVVVAVAGDVVVAGGVGDSADVACTAESEIGVKSLEIELLLIARSLSFQINGW